MKKILTLGILLFISTAMFSQNMTNEKLEKIIEYVSDSIQGQSGRWQFYVKDVAFICLTDSTNNRMRIISPIIEAFQLTEDLKNASLMANFHTALDVKYAISNEVLWSAFIHPLKELSEAQVKDAISQVYAANVSFGTTFSSTSLIFPGITPANEKEKENKKERF